MRFETLRRLRYLAKRGDWAFSFDLQDGYYALGLREDVRDFFTINVRGTLWRFAALPMGWSLSPYYFCTLMAVMVRYLRQPDFATYSSYGRPFRRRLRRRKASGVCLLPFIDDFLFLAPSRQLALRLWAEVERLWGRLGLAKHPTKAHPEPTQQLQHLGMDLDLVTMQFRAPAAKLRRLSNLARDLLCIAARHRRHAPAKLLASLAGQGQFLYLAMPPARFYLREAHTVLGRCSSPSGKVVLTRQLIRDLEWWRDVPTRHNGAPILRPVETAYLHTHGLQPLLDDLVLKLQQSGAAATVVAPAWHGRPWLQQLHEMPGYRAINAFFTDNFKEPPALGPFVNQAMRGWELAQQVLDAPDYRVPLPADVALACVRRAQRLVSHRSIACDLPTFRALLVTAVNFLFCHRAGTSTGCGVRDLAVDSRSITLYRRVLKGKPSGAPRPVLQISREAHPEIAELLEFFVSCRDHVLPGATRFWQLPDDDPGTWTAATVSEWVTAAALAVEATPPTGFCWSSHSLRSGGASAASATGVPVPTIRWLGGWKVGSGVVLNYIVPGILDSAGARYFFGSLAPQRSAANLSQ
eukprot:jgi/Tetstr1/427531/TSEL_017657.t1